MPAVSSRRSRPPAGKPERGDKRDALLRAAIETFAARGYFNAQVADVARTAGVAAGTVYLYFRGKDDLLISIFEKDDEGGDCRRAREHRRPSTIRWRSSGRSPACTWIA